MELSPANKAALALRIAAVFPGRLLPESWSDLTLTEQMILLQQDVEAANILQGNVTAEQAAALFSEGLNPEAPADNSAAEYQEAMAAALAQMNEQTAATAARNAERAQQLLRLQDTSIGAYS